jgi:hypothetical protein
MGSPLDLVSSEGFRKKLITKNLAPYAKSPRRTTPPTNYEYIQSDTSVVDSPDNLIDEPSYANKLYPLNQYGNEGGYEQVPDPGGLLNTKSNEGEYGYQDANILGQSLPESQKWKPLNVFSDGGELPLDSAEFFDSMNRPQATTLYNNQPYPTTFVPSTYSPVSILLSPDPQGTNGLLSQDSFIAKLGAETLRAEFQRRIATGIRQNTIGRINAFNVRGGTDILNLVTGRVPLLEPNYQITVPANPILAATDFALRLAGTIIPTSTIPGSYFDPLINQRQPTTIQQLTNAFRRSAVGKFFNRLVGADKSGSQLFLNNTGGGQKSRLFDNIDYNKYKPNYQRTIFDRLAGALVGTVESNSNFYVGSITSDPSRVFSPGGDLPVNTYGQEQETPVYGPTELAQLYEGVSREIKLGANGPTYSNGGGIEGGFTWVSPKYKDNAGKKVGIGGEILDQDQDFKPSSYNSTESTNIEFKQGSILDDTQRIIDSQPQGGRRLQHVGNAIDQVSKIFHDGYNEMTKGSRVLTYTGSIGQEVGTEYCRVFAKDIPYLQYNDLQKTDGMTTQGRKFAYSVMDSTYNLNIAPNKREGGQDSTNLVLDTAAGVSYAKKYMFSIENLAWRTSATPGFSVTELPICERGPNSGRVMWFPPYGLTFNESVSANWKSTDFLGRPEPVYTYTNTQRTGSLTWKIVVDHPSVLNVIVNKVLSNETNKNRVNSILESFFAGCRKYDLYELAKKYYTVSPGELNELQQIINSGDLSKEQLGFIRDSVATGKDNSGNQATLVAEPSQNTPSDDLKQFQNFSLYFPNNDPVKGTVSSYPSYYSIYLAQTGSTNYSQADLQNFFSNVVVKNYDEVQNNFFVQLSSTLENNPNRIVTITLEGSASGAGTTPYNLTLSERRIDSVIKFFQSEPSLGKFINLGRIKFKQVPKGENANAKRWEPKEGKFVETQFSCSDSDDSESVNNNSQIYSLSAMGCRRVSISSIVATTGVPNQQPAQPSQPAGGPGNEPLRPIAAQNIETKIRKPDNITKRVLRTLLSECDYFETIKEETPMVFDSLKEKLKFFQPAFHSTTPEGLNSRLTFLQQCMRPGDTIPTVKEVGGKQELQFNDAVNTAFGAPPVLVLRIGDFYNTKIIPDGLQISYESLDINPEGIGVQPMIANITMSFKFVGGSGLKESIDKLQNALTFNYYANTEMWDDRADVTDDSLKVLDKEFLQLVNQAAAPTVNQVPNLNGQSNENTIGDRITTVVTASGETGTISYQQFMDNFVSTTQTYFQTVVNKSRDALNQYNNAILQNWSTSRIYTKGHFLVQPSDDVYLFGKPDSIQQIIDKVTNDFVGNIESTTEATQDPFMFFMTRDQKQFNEKAIRELRKNFVNYVKNKKGTFQNALTKINQDMVNAQQTYLQFISRANTAPYNTGSGTQLDGFQQKNGNLKLYKVSGTTQVGPGSTAANTLLEMVDDITKIKTNLNEFYVITTELSEFNYQGNAYKGYLVYGETKENTTSKSLESVVFNQYSKDNKFISLPFKREYMLLSNDLKSENYQTFKNALIGNIINNDKLLGKGNTNISQEFDAYWLTQAKPLFEQENALTQSFLTEMETNKLKNFIKYTPFPSKTRLFDYDLNTNPSDNEQKLIKALGASTNQSTDKLTWNDPQGAIFISKVKLN